MFSSKMQFSGGGSRFRISCGVACGVLAMSLSSASAQFDASNVKMYSQVTLGDLGVDSGNDCWGYTSPSGREYAIMGTNSKTVFIEVTDPVNPVIIHSASHSDSFTGDIKVYLHYAYSVGDRYGMQVFDMNNIDNGVVTKVSTEPYDSHNLALNEESGFAYLCASSVNSGITALDLSNPTNPVVAGSTNPTGNHVHDAEVVNYHSGPWAGREIAFCPSGQSGLDIIDVTDKGNMVRLSHTEYAGQNYSHQCWLSESKQYLYFDDELDELEGDTPTTRTLVFDVSDLTDPVLVNTFTTGTPATDHNLYVHEGFLYEANYKSGMHIFDTRSNVVSPDYVGYFDTFPSNDNAGFDGAWSVFPFFDSGLVIVSDISRGLFMLDCSAARGERIDLSATNLVGGQQVTLDASNATPNQTVYFAYSLAGESWTFVNALNVYLELQNPQLAGKRKANGSGDASFSGKVPGNLTGQTAWLQAAQFNRTSNLVEEVVQ